MEQLTDVNKYSAKSSVDLYKMAKAKERRTKRRTKRQKGKKAKRQKGKKAKRQKGKKRQEDT